MSTFEARLRKRCRNAVYKYSNYHMFCSLPNNTFQEHELDWISKSYEKMGFKFSYRVSKNENCVPKISWKNATFGLAKEIYDLEVDKIESRIFNYNYKIFYHMKLLFKDFDNVTFKHTISEKTPEDILNTILERRTDTIDDKLVKRVFNSMKRNHPLEKNLILKDLEYTSSSGKLGWYYRFEYIFIWVSQVLGSYDKVVITLSPHWFGVEV